MLRSGLRRHQALCFKEAGKASPTGDALWEAQMFIGSDSKGCNVML